MRDLDDSLLNTRCQISQFAPGFPVVLRPVSNRRRSAICGGDAV